MLCFNFEIQSRFADQAILLPNMLGIPWLIPTRNASDMENKSYFHRWMIENNFSQYLPRDKHISDFPYVLKIGNGHSAKYVHLIKNSTDLHNLNIHVEENQYVCQEYINSPFEYVFHFIAQDGTILKALTYKHIFSELSTDGCYIKGRGFFNKDIQRVDLEGHYYDVISSIIKKCNFTGVGCIDFKISNSKLFIFEFNSRMGGSLFYFDHILHDLDEFIIALSQQAALPRLL